MLCHENIPIRLPAISKIFFKINCLSIANISSDQNLLHANISQTSQNNPGTQHAFMLSPQTQHRQNPSQSQSLTRLNRHIPYRFKSLTTQLSDSSNEQPASTHEISTSNSNLLSPNNILSKSNQRLDVTYTNSVRSQMNQQVLKQMQKKYSKSVDASFKKGSTLNWKLSKDDFVNEFI